VWDDVGEDDAHRAWVSGVPITADVKNEDGGDPMSRVRAVVVPKRHERGSSDRDSYIGGIVNETGGLILFHERAGVPRSSPTRLASSAILLRRWVASSMVGSSLVG